MTGTTRRLFADEFKREAVGLLASSGRLLSQITGALGIAASRLRAWRNKGDGVAGGIAVAPQFAGGDPACRHGFGRRECPLAARERASAHGAGDSKKNAAHLLGSAEMKFRLIEDQREAFPVHVMCDVLGVTPSGLRRMQMKSSRIRYRGQSLGTLKLPPQLPPRSSIG